MKKIGFIYKYNPSEGMGILVFGVWKVKSSWGSTIKNTPILFSDNDLLSKVSTGQLVFFDFNDNKTATNIERASLSNFKVDFINSIVRCGQQESEYSFYNDNTKISFEYLDTIIIPEEKKKQLVTNQEASEENFSLDDLDDILDEEDDDFGIDLELFEEEDSKSFIPTENEVKNLIETSDSLPESIDEVFNCFGKYKHKTYDSITIDVFDLSLWLDQDILRDKYYGMNVEELNFLYDIFVMRKHYDQKGNVVNYKPANDVISSKWALLLSKLSDSDLKTLLYSAPKLQPAFPKEFCKKNVGLLTDDYGMPDVEICKLYCLHKISNTYTVSGYKELKHRLFVYYHCGAKHLEGEGTPMCQMGKRRINNLEKRLDLQYENIIKQNVISQLIKICEDANVVNEIKKATSDEINSIGLFLENLYALRNDFLGYNVYEKTFESYEKLPNLYKDALMMSLLNCVNESAILATKNEYISPFLLGYQIEQLNGWILDSTKQQIKELVNEKFSNLDDLEELNNAYKYDYITSKQYFKRYKQLTSDFNTHQFLKELSDYKIKDSPLTIQWYVTSNIIKKLGYDSLNSFDYVKLDYYDAISDIRSLIKWLNNYGHLKDIVLKKAEETICSVLSDDERWILFEEKIAKSPGDANIRKRLDIAYKKKYANKELFKHECFQDAMLSDVDKVKAPEVLLFIADNLDNCHQYLMQQKATGFLKLYLWQKQPSGKFDWDLVKSHFYEMSAEAQIKTLRYIFGQIASGESVLAVDDLYSEFVETSTPACPAVCGMLFILKAKKDDINISITPTMMETVIGENLKHRFNFLKDSRELFYPCNGYLAITQNQQDIEYQSFNGILKKEIKDDTWFYIITFHDTPVNLFGRTIEWLDSEEVDTAIQVLKRNCDVEIVNGKYYIPESQEFFVKQFVIAYNIDDKCGLLSDKERMIELGYLPRNNAVQPLYTNCLRKYEDSEYYICRCGCPGCSDPNNGFPFYWCKKKICVRRAHFFLPSSEWERFRFADFLFIALGQNSSERESVWLVNAEISQFICDYFKIFELNERNISSTPLIVSEEKGIWDKESSTYRDIYDDEEYNDEEYNDEEYDGGDYDDYSHDYEEQTYDRYNGSYAQDEMGYSDDDIDTIFDGDPEAYWNID